MTLARRLDRLEAGLSPTQLVNRWLDEALPYGSLEAYAAATVDLPGDEQPINRLAREASEGVRARFGTRRGEDYQAALRGALRQTVLRFELVMRANIATHELTDRAMLVTALLAAQLTIHLSDRRARTNRPMPEVPLAEVRHAAFRWADDQLALRQAVRTVEARYFEGHPILFPEIDEASAGQTRRTQENAAMLDACAQDEGVAGLTPPTPDDVAALEAQRLADLIEPARSAALDKLGEDERAIAIAAAWLRPRLTLPRPSASAAERGQGLAEFALVLALIAVVTIAALLVLGGQLTTILNPGH
jgi:hypothetical protein